LPTAVKAEWELVPSFHSALTAVGNHRRM